jgi:hypothetical protein
LRKKQLSWRHNYKRYLGRKFRSKHARNGCKFVYYDAHEKSGDAIVVKYENVTTEVMHYFSEKLAISLAKAMISSILDLGLQKT